MSGEPECPVCGGPRQSGADTCGDGNCEGHKPATCETCGGEGEARDLNSNGQCSGCEAADDRQTMRSIARG